MISFKKFLESKSTQYQIKIGTEWIDADLGVASLQRIFNEMSGGQELNLFALHSDPSALGKDDSSSRNSVVAIPKLHKIILAYYGATHQQDNDFFDEESDYSVTSFKDDALVLHYGINIRTTSGKYDRHVSGTVTILPSN